MTRLQRHLPLPASWASVRGLELTDGGLFGVVVDEADAKIILFEGLRVITADAFGWRVTEVVACLSSFETPVNVEPRIAYLTEGDLQPLLACGAITRIDVLWLMAHVPGWTPS